MILNRGMGREHAYQWFAGADERAVDDEVSLALQLDDVALPQVPHVAVAQGGRLPPLHRAVTTIITSRLAVRQVLVTDARRSAFCAISGRSQCCSRHADSRAARNRIAEMHVQRRDCAARNPGKHDTPVPQLRGGITLKVQWSTECGLTRSSILSSSSGFFFVMRCPKSTQVSSTRSSFCAR